MTKFRVSIRSRRAQIGLLALALLLGTATKAAAYFCFDDCINEYGLTVEVNDHTYWYTSCTEFDMGGGAVGVTCYYTRFVWN